MVITKLFDGLTALPHETAVVSPIFSTNYTIRPKVIFIITEYTTGAIVVATHRFLPFLLLLGSPADSPKQATKGDYFIGYHCLRYSKKVHSLTKGFGALCSLVA